MRKVCLYILFLFAVILTSCEMQLRPFGEEPVVVSPSVLRYDRMESRYLSTGDFTALQQMNTVYAQPTRLLVEDILRLGEVDSPEVPSLLLAYAQDSLMQTLIADVENVYASTAAIEKDLEVAFNRMSNLLPDVPWPVVYTQIGFLHQSVIVGDSIVGISLDKYLGSDYPLYAMYYDENQRVSMSQEYIVPDVLVFYLISHYPLSNFEVATPEERDTHMGRVMYVANQLMNRQFFDTGQVSAAARLVKSEGMSLQELLRAQ